jgi:hypothetical protein
VSTRGNNLGRDGWSIVIETLDSLSALVSINSFGRYNSLATSHLVDLAVSKNQLGPLELVDVVALLLPRHALSLTSLDLGLVE